MLLLVLVVVVVVVKRIITDQSEREEGKKNRDVLTETRRGKTLEISPKTEKKSREKRSLSKRLSLFCRFDHL